MADEINRTADWEPGTLDKTRKNIGLIDEKEAATMAKKLGGQVMYERTTSSSGGTANQGSHGQGRIIRASDGGKGGSGGSGGSSKPNTTYQAPRRHIREDLPQVSKKFNSAVDKLMMSSEYKIKANYGIFNFIRSLQKNGTEKVLPEFYQYKMKKDIEHMEAFSESQLCGDVPYRLSGLSNLSCHVKCTLLRHSSHTPPYTHMLPL